VVEHARRKAMLSTPGMGFVQTCISFLEFARPDRWETSITLSEPKKMRNNTGNRMGEVEEEGEASKFGVKISLSFPPTRFPRLFQGR
jgi:hypothetical protein